MSGRGPIRRGATRRAAGRGSPPWNGPFHERCGYRPAGRGELNEVTVEPFATDHAHSRAFLRQCRIVGIDEQAEDMNFPFAK